MTRALTSANRGVYFTRTFFGESWAFGAASVSGFWRTFRPQFLDVPNYIDYRALFDMYKVHSIKVSFHPRYNVLQQPNVGVTAAGPTTNQLYLTYMVDTEHDYAFNPSGSYSAANFNSFLEKAGSKSRTVCFNKPVSFTFKPRIIDDLGGGFNMKPCPWLNASIMSTPLYGAHVFLHDYAFTALNEGDFGCDIQYTFKFSCKGQN